MGIEQSSVLILQLVLVSGICNWSGLEDKRQPGSRICGNKILWFLVRGYGENEGEHANEEKFRKQMESFILKVKRTLLR